MKKKVAFFTLGCKVNYCETEALQALFEQCDYKITAFEDKADVYVINTCTVTANSDHKSRKAIRQARKRAPQAIVIATGCYAENASGKIEKMEEVDLIVGNRDRERLPQILQSLSKGQAQNLVAPQDLERKFEILPPVKKRGRIRGFLKIQDGCEQYCSYCIVPLVRGNLRSLQPEEVVLRAKKLVKSGCREIVLTGIHLGLYGIDLDNVTLASIIPELEKIPGLIRLRLSSLEPSDINTELVEQIADSWLICPHLHIPLQSGDGEILRMMNRPYEPVEYLYLAKWLKQEIPGLALSTDVMVGFPGETEKHHQRSMQLINKIGFSRLHVFRFSPRPGTAAAGYSGQVPVSIKNKRSKDMIALGDEMASAYRRQFLGSVQPVLVEKVVPYSHAEGLTSHYLRVKINMEIKGLHWRNKLINARLEKEDGSVIRAVKIRKNKTLVR